MKKTKNYILSINEGRTALRLSLIIGLILIFIMLITFIFARLMIVGRDLHLFDVLTLSSAYIFLSNIVLLYILFRFQFWIIKLFRKPRKQIFWLILGSVGLVFIFSPLFSYLQRPIIREEIPLNLYTVAFFSKDMTLMFITLLFTFLLRLWESTKKTWGENQKLSVESIQNRYDALKNQVDPHFLFNSLNTLNGLIGYDDEKAQEYVTQLSSVFRYTTQSKKITQLSEELDFVNSYIHLMKIRYDEALRIDFHLDEKYFGYYILPFGLQSLLENAVKHNVITMKYPLSITIETTDRDTIKVKNNIRLKMEEGTSGIGLSNLDERYKLIFNKEIVIHKDDSFFTVEIPLIKDIEVNKDKFNNEL